MIAKTCHECGRLQPRERFSGHNPTGRLNCMDCDAWKERRERREAGSKVRLMHRGVVLLAATCGGCCKFKPASEFYVRKGRPVVHLCKACSWARRPERSADEAVADSGQHREGRQAETLPNAKRHGQQWTGPELEIVARRDLTAREAALMLGRSFVAVNSARQKLKDPKWRSIAGVGDRVP